MSTEANQSSPVEQTKNSDEKVMIERSRLEKLQASTQELASAAEQISQSTDEINGVGAEQADNMAEVTDEISTLSATVEEIASSADQVSAESRKARELAEERDRKSVV